jgi:hypothetical protein
VTDVQAHSFFLSKVITLGVAENFVLRKAPTRDLLVLIATSNNFLGKMVVATCEKFGFAGPAPSEPFLLDVPVLIAKGEGVFIKCEYSGVVPNHKKYGEKFTFTIELVGRSP